jgi:hypothetical protein
MGLEQCFHRPLQLHVAGALALDENLAMRRWMFW